MRRALSRWVVCQLETTDQTVVTPNNEPIDLPLYLIEYAVRYNQYTAWLPRQVTYSPKAKYCLKSGLKHSTYSVVMHSLCTQDTKSPSLPMTSPSFLAQKHLWISKWNNHPQNSNLEIQRHSRSTFCLTKSHKVSFKIWSLISTVHFCFFPLKAEKNTRVRQKFSTLVFFANSTITKHRTFTSWGTFVTF